MNRVKVHLYTEFDIRTGRRLIDIVVPYVGPIAECKRSKSKKLAEEQLALMNQYIARVLGIQEQAILPLIPKLQEFVLNPRGFSPEALAAMRGQAIEGTSQRFADLESQLKTTFARRGAAGGDIPFAGAFAKGIGELGALRELGISDAIRDVIRQDDLLRLQNLFNAANVLTGHASIFRPDPFVQGSASALQARTQLAFGPGSNLLGSLLGAGIGAIGAGLAEGGAFAAGGALAL